MRNVICALLAALAVVALGACGGGSSKTTPATAATSGDFCQQLANIGPANVAEDPTGAKRAVATLKQLHPPAEIASQWDDYIKAIDEIANTDPNDRAKLGSIAQAHIQSFSAIGVYVSKNCVSAFSGSLSSFSTG